MAGKELGYRDLGVGEAKADDLNERMRSAGIKEADLDETFVRGSGRGGQKVNKSNNAVQLVHVPSGRRVSVHDDRSRALNRFYARRRLVEAFEAEQRGDDSPEARRRAKARKQKERRRRRAKKKAQG